MVRLMEFNRTATFAWSHDKLPRLVTGTVSGTIDANFTNESNLELWDIVKGNDDDNNTTDQNNKDNNENINNNNDNISKKNDNNKPIASLSVDAKFNDLDWSIDNKIISGALEDGSLQFFNVVDNIENENITDTTINSIGKFNYSNSKSVIKTIKFNPKQSNVLISGDSKGEILIWDTNKCINSTNNNNTTSSSIVQDYQPMKPGMAMTSMDEIQSLAWNRSLAHVFASTGSSTFAAIWDLKAKKEVIHLSYTSPLTGLKPQLSVVEWHPSNSTRLVTATGSDTEPQIIMWDLRNSNTPLNILSGGHSKGILSLDWCQNDETLLLSSGRDNSVVLWDPINSEKLTQFPPKGNWTFKSKFAPYNSDFFATASYDSKVEIQSLQNLVNDLDQEQTVNKQHESETEFWDNVLQEESTEKPTVFKLHAPNWYGNKSPGAHWAFGGKLVNISNDGLSVHITTPKIAGLEKNKLLNDALKGKDFDAIINIRLAKSINKVNEDDWSLLEKLTMDGRDEFLKDSFNLDEEDEDENVNAEKGGDLKEKETTDDDINNVEKVDDGEQFFEKIENKFEPVGKFNLGNDLETSIVKKLLNDQTKEAIDETLKNDLLLESLMIVLNSNDQLLKEKVKNAYFTKYGNQSNLARFIYCTDNQHVQDMVTNLDIDNWKYIVQTIDKYYSNQPVEQNRCLIELGDRLFEVGKRQEAFSVYLAADSIDSVAKVWLKEFSEMEDLVKKDNKTIYEAHSECLTEFIERFTVFSSFIGNAKIENNALISKFLEFVDLASASGDFDLAAEFLNILPHDNEQVKTEKERVLLASGKSTKAKIGAIDNSKSSKQHYRANIPPMQPLSHKQTVQNIITPPVVGATPQVPSKSIYAPAQTMTPAPSTINATPVMGSQQQMKPASNPYAPSTNYQSNAPPVSGLSYNNSNYNKTVTPPPPVAPYNSNNYINKKPTPPISDMTTQNAAPITSSYMPPVNPYAAAAAAAAEIPMTNNELNNDFVDGTRNNSINSGVISGQKPYLNKKANDGWNDFDLTLTVKDGKPARAKAMSVVFPNDSMVNKMTSPGSNNVPTPPAALSRRTSSASIVAPPPPIGIKKKDTSSKLAEVMTPPKPQVNPYAPQANTNAMGTPPSSTTRFNETNSLPPTKPPLNPYAPSAGMMAPPVAGSVAPPIINPTSNSRSNISTPSLGPPPMNTKRRTNLSQQQTETSGITGSLDQIASSSNNTGAVQSTPAANNVSPETLDTNVTTTIPEDQREIIDFLKEELERVTPLTPKEYSKQLKDCDKRLKILYQHLENQDLLTQPTIDKLKQIIVFLKEKKYSEAMQIHIDIATNHSHEGGNWLTGIKRLIGIAEATSN